jgi:hypothetical protein
VLPELEELILELWELPELLPAPEEPFWPPMPLPTKTHFALAHSKPAQQSLVSRQLELLLPHTPSPPSPPPLLVQPSGSRAASATRTLAGMLEWRKEPPRFG